MIKETRIAVDAMGGDGGPEIIMPSIKDFILENDDVNVEIYGNEKILSTRRNWCRKFFPSLPKFYK